MKRVLLIGIFLLLFSSPLSAQHLYVTDTLKATFRTGPGNDHKILRMVSSGEKLTVLEAQEKWTMVRLPNGSEGWVLNQWLTEETPKGIQLNTLQGKYDRLLEKYSSLKESSDASGEENKQLKSDLAICSKKERDCQKDYDALKKGSESFLQLQADYKKVKTSLEEISNKADRLNDELTQKQITWFLSGAGVLLLGIMIGFTSKRKRRHSLLD